MKLTATKSKLKQRTIVWVHTQKTHGTPRNNTKSNEKKCAENFYLNTENWQIYILPEHLQLYASFIFCSLVGLWMEVSLRFLNLCWKISIDYNRRNFNQIAKHDRKIHTFHELGRDDKKINTTETTKRSIYVKIRKMRLKSAIERPNDMTNEKHTKMLRSIAFGSDSHSHCHSIGIIMSHSSEYSQRLRDFYWDWFVLCGKR